MPDKQLNIAEFSHTTDGSNITATHNRTNIKVFVGGTDILLYEGENKSSYLEQNILLLNILIFLDNILHHLIIQK